MKRKTWIESEQEFILSTARSVPCLDRQLILQSILAASAASPPPRCANGTKCEAVSIGATYPVNALIHGLCYFCHLYATNYAYASAVNGETDFGSIQLPFYVKTNLPGQYCHEKTLQLAQGPFPFYDKNHYVCTEDGSWHESNVMCYANGLSVKSDRVLPDHPMGEGEQLHPIRPSYISCTTYDIPTVEKTLYHQYGLLGKKTNKRFAQCVFQESLRESHKALLPLFQHPKCMKERVKSVVHAKEQELDAYLAAPTTPNGNDCMHQTWYATVWCRVYGFPVTPKLMEFRNRHVPLFLYFETLPGKDDKYVDPEHLCALYKGLGPTQYDEDRNLIERVTVRYPTRKETWLDIVKNAYPSMIWTVEDAMDYLECNVKSRNEIIANIVSSGYSAPGLPWEGYKYHYSCTMIMVQCRSANQSSVSDALWFYHGCFLDFYFAHANTPDSEIDFDRVYPHPNRCFTAYDLPNAFHVLMNIPNHGEKKKPDFVLGKFIQKTLPFCCAYRTLIKLTDSLIASDLAFWKVFQHVFYCLLLDMYPDQPTRRYDIANMMRAMRLCADRNAMRAAITRSQVSADDNDETDRGCNIIYTAFRMWILFMTKDQRHYNAFAHDLSNEFAQKTYEMARLIRVDDSPDPFASSRDLLQSIKSSRLVYRYQNQNLVHTLHEKMSVRLEKKLYIKQNDDIQHLSDYIKTNILNDLIYTPKHEWLKRDCMERLYAEKFGGISANSIECFVALLHLYTKGAKPKEYELLLEKIEDYDFQVIAWYVFVVKTLQSFQFEAVSLQWRAQLQSALMNRKQLWSPTACSIYVTICCNKIKSLTGIEEYGTNNVALDMKTGTYVCAKTPKKIEIDGLMAHTAPQSKKEKRDRRKNFYTIPCEGNPVIPIDLEGCILYYKNATRYLHCPSCGAFHIYKTTNWMGCGELYHCENCKKQPKPYTTCKMCALPATDATCTIMDPTDLTDPIQHVYFCKNHATHAKTNAHNLAWSDLSKLIGERHYKRMTK